MAIQRILIVDDSPTERFYLTDILERSGFAVSTATNGEEAMLKIAADKPEPSFMAGVMPTRRSSAAAMSHSHSPNTAEYLGPQSTR